jgi:hypothetical protein
LYVYVIRGNTEADGCSKMDSMGKSRTSCDLVKRWLLLVTLCELSCFMIVKVVDGRYGSSCNLVLSCGQGVDGFTLDEVRQFSHLGEQT